MWQGWECWGGCKGDSWICNQLKSDEVQVGSEVTFLVVFFFLLKVRRTSWWHLNFVFIITPKMIWGRLISNLTSIFFRWVGSTTNQRIFFLIVVRVTPPEVFSQLAKTKSQTFGEFHDSEPSVRFKKGAEVAVFNFQGVFLDPKGGERSTQKGMTGRERWVFFPQIFGKTWKTIFVSLSHDFFLGII